MLNLSNNYKKILVNYLEWKNCKSPLGAHAARKALPTLIFTKEGVSAEEAVFTYESHGKLLNIKHTDEVLAIDYFFGKSNKDWWFQEKGWWDKYSAYTPEEFLTHLTPECFFQLFSRFPSVHLTRLVYDNNYTEKQFEIDSTRYFKGLETVRGGVQSIL